MRTLSKINLKLILSGILFLCLLTGCGEGDGGSSSSGTTGGSPDGGGTGTPANSIQSTEAYTDSNGVASFTLSDGRVNTAKFTDNDAGNPIAGIKAVLTTNGTDGFYMILDENGNYPVQIQSYKSTTHPEDVVKGVVSDATTFALRKFSVWRYEDKNPPTVTADRVLPTFWEYFKNRETEYVETRKLKNLSSFFTKTTESIALGADLVLDLTTLGLVNATYSVVSAPFTCSPWVETNASECITEGLSNLPLIGEALDIFNIGSYSYWEDQFRTLGYSGEDEIDIYRIKSNRLKGVGLSIIAPIILVPRKPIPYPHFGIDTSLVGLISDSSGKPIEGAKVILIYPSLSTNVETTTDSVGFFVLKLPVPMTSLKQCTIRIDKTGYDGIIKAISGVSLSLPINVTLENKKGKLELKIINSENSFPVENVNVTLTDSKGNKYIPTRTPNGIYINYLPAGTYKVLIEKPGYTSKEESNIEVLSYLTTSRIILVSPTLSTTLPDLTVSLLFVDSNYSSGQTVQIPVTVSRSSGNLTFANNVEMEIYWSNDTTWNSTDLTLWYDNANYTINSLNTNDSVTISASLTIPSVSTGIPLYLIAVVDKNNYHGESNEFNNIMVYPINVQASTSVPPNQSSNLKATALSSDRIVLYWNDNSDNETGFKIERRLGSTGSFSQFTAVGNNVSYYEDSGLSPNTQYFYRVRAYNSYGDSALYSNEASVTTPASTSLPTVTTTNAANNITSNSATLNGYINPNGINTGFFFQYGTNSSSYGNLTANQIIGTTAGNVATAITGLLPNTTYYFRIVAVVAGGNIFGSQMSFMTAASTSGSVATATTNTASNITTNSAILNGTVNPNGLSTIVYFQYSANTSNWLTIGNTNAGSGTTATSWQANVAGLAPNTTFYFRIVASNSAGTTNGATQTFTTLASSTSNNSPVISSVIPNPNPPVTVGSTVSLTCVSSDIDGDALAYTWTSTGGSISGFGSVVSWIAPSAASTYTVTCSVSDGKGGSASRGLSISVISSTTTTPPLAPSNLVATALSQNIIALVWQDNSNNETGFKIERKTGTAGSYSQITTVPAQTGSGSGVYYDDTGLMAGTTYCYKVRAYNTYDSSYSNESCATTKTQQPLQPTAITGSATNITSNSATLNGTVNPNGVSSGAFFQYGTSTAFGYTTPSQVLGSGTNNINVIANLTGLSSNTVYYFRILATNSTGGTTFGTTQSFVTNSSGGSLPGSFTLSGTAGCSGSSPANNLSWAASSGAASYAVDRCTGSGCTPSWYYNLATLGTTFTNTNVAAGTTYIYFIRATNAYGYTDSNRVTITTRSSCP